MSEEHRVSSTLRVHPATIISFTIQLHTHAWTHTHTHTVFFEDFFSLYLIERDEREWYKSNRPRLRLTVQSCGMQLYIHAYS